MTLINFYFFEIYYLYITYYQDSTAINRLNKSLYVHLLQSLCHKKNPPKRRILMVVRYYLFCIWNVVKNSVTKYFRRIYSSCYRIKHVNGTIKSSRN